MRQRRPAGNRRLRNGLEQVRIPPRPGGSAFIAFDLNLFEKECKSFDHTRYFHPRRRVMPCGPQSRRPSRTLKCFNPRQRVMPCGSGDTPLVSGCVSTRAGASCLAANSNTSSPDTGRFQPAPARHALRLSPRNSCLARLFQPAPARHALRPMRAFWSNANRFNPRRRVMPCGLVVTVAMAFCFNPRRRVMPCGCPFRRREMAFISMFQPAPARHALRQYSCGYENGDYACFNPRRRVMPCGTGVGNSASLQGFSRLFFRVSSNFCENRPFFARLLRHMRYPPASWAL